MSRNYKYGFADQILIHAQRPDASACAEYDVWTGRMGRYVRRGAKGIALVDYSGDAPKLRYVFDVSDTGARRDSRPFRPWTVNDENLAEVQLGLKQDFGAGGEWLSSQLQDAAHDLAEMYFDEHRHDIGAIIDGSLMAGYDEGELRDSFIRAASTSTAYTLISRCGYDPSAYFEESDFAFLNEWNTPAAATALGSAVSENTQLVLREIERTIRSYERSLHNDRTSLHDRERRANPQPDPARDGADRTVREDASEASEGAPAGAVEPPRADGDAVRAPERDRDGGSEPYRPDAAETGSGSGRDGGVESHRPNEVDGTDERLQSPGRRSSSERVNLQLNLFDEAEDADAPSAFTFHQDEIIDTTLRESDSPDFLHERVVAELDDTPVNIQPHEPISSAYGVGDFVWFEGREYQITNLQRGHVELLPPGSGFPVYRTESRADFERELQEDERNRYITDYLTAEMNDDAHEPHTKTVAYYEAEKTHLPYDVVFQTIGSAPEPEPTQPEPSVSPETPRNFRIMDDQLGEGGAKARFRANMDAITTLKRIEAEGRTATAEEQEILSRYVGWGAIPDAFDESKPEWKREFEELKAALTPEEYEAARSSTLNAHYTSPTVIRAIYDALVNLGFEGGRILEPSCGVGNFFGLLPDSMADSQLYGVELDSITGRIAKQLYPEAEITVAGFETTNRPGFFDLAVGNVPFGNYQVFDPEYNRLSFSIHNYFAAKMLNQVRPGGIVAFVTSRYTMDAKDESVRRYLAARGELLGAIRLPNNAFLANAGAGVVSDIIFLQRRELPLTELPDWVHVGENEDGFTVNRYFLDHPEMVLGVPTAESTQYGRQDYTAVLLHHKPWTHPISTQSNDEFQAFAGWYQGAKAQ